MNRNASHAGSWYKKNGNELKMLFDSLAKKIPPYGVSFKPFAIVVPHAGYAYSAETAWHSYSMISGFKYDRIILLGPCHHCNIVDKIAVSNFDAVETPLGSIPTDDYVTDGLLALPGFVRLSHDDDLNEHSLEMQYPFIYYLFQNSIPIVPLLVGRITNSDIFKDLAGKLMNFISDNSLLIISSDFCHWGKRFNYTFHMQPNLPIFQSIEAMDKLAINSLLSLDKKQFELYLNETKNTICGAFPLRIFLEIVEKMQLELSGHLMKYSQSEQVNNEAESSVSYASIIFLKK